MIETAPIWFSIYRLTESIVGGGTPPTARGPGWCPTNRNN